MTTASGREWLLRLAPRGAVVLGDAAGSPSTIGDAVARVGDRPVCWAIEVGRAMAATIIEQIPEFGGGEGPFETLRMGTESSTLRSLVLLAAMQAPVSFLHHTSWQVDDVDDVGRGAAAMLDGHPDRNVWGLGRHHAGSNFFWYLKDPAGNFSEYYSDMDSAIDDQLWTPETLKGAKGLFSWGPPPPPSFLAPEDLAELMVGAHLPG
jgi:hypothetical protein